MVVELGVTREVTLVISPILLDELHEKLRCRFGVSDKDALAIRAKVQSAAELIEPDIQLELVKEDPDDNRVLECAVSGHADCIVSGDRHLLKLRAHGGIRILTARAFLNTIKG